MCVAFVTKRQSDNVVHFPSIRLIVTISTNKVCNGSVMHVNNNDVISMNYDLCVRGVFQFEPETHGSFQE